MAGNAAERWERSPPNVADAVAAALVRDAVAHGARLEARPGGRLWAVPLAALPASLRERLATHRAAVLAWLERQGGTTAELAPQAQRRAHEVSATIPECLRASPPPNWQALPYSPARGAAFMAARLQPGACPCCAGQDWWQQSAGPVCTTCHPPPRRLTPEREPQ